MDNKNNKIVVNSSGLSNNVNIQNAFVELINDNHYIENSIYWLNKYIEECKECKDDIIIKIKNLLEISQANINEAFIILDNMVSK